MTRVRDFRRLRVRGAAEALDIAAALAWEAGALGCEEDESGSELMVYTESRNAKRIESSLRPRVGLRESGLVWVGWEPVPARDWSLEHRAFQPAVEVSQRLRVRPPWLAGTDADVVIAARQAFGTGTHVSTALALEALDRHLSDGVRRADDLRVFDLGCGSGVLSIAALRLGAQQVFACDTDPLAARETAENARANRVAGRLWVWCGGVAAVQIPPVDLAIANMIRREILPELGALVSVLSPVGWLWLSGLLASDREEIARALAEHAFRIESESRRDDGPDAWIAVGARRIARTPR